MSNETNNPNDPFVTKAMLEEAIKASEKRVITAVGELLNDLMYHIDVRFNRIEKRLDNHGKRLKAVENWQAKY